MATEKQIAANRANAQLSTGPKTEEGKDMSRRNGLVHGLTSMGFILPEHMETEILQTVDWLNSTLKPANAFEDKLTNTLSFHMVASEDANRMQLARKLVISLETITTWDDKHLAEAAALAETLHKNPGSVSRRLRGSKHGCLVMIEHWEQLDEILVRQARWDDDQKSMALDLLGVSATIRKSGSVLDVPDGISPREYLRPFVREQIKKLETKIQEEVGVLDQAKYNLALLGNDPLDEPMRLLKRYGREHLSIMLKIRAELRHADRIGFPGLPSGFPTKRTHETRTDFYDRCNDWKVRNQVRQEKEREVADRQRKLDNEAADRLERDPQPVFREGMPLDVYIQLVTDWNRRRTGTSFKPLEALPVDAELVTTKALADAMPDEAPPEAEATPEYPADPDSTPPAPPVKKPRKRHDK